MGREERINRLVDGSVVGSEHVVPKSEGSPVRTLDEKSVRLLGDKGLEVKWRTNGEGLVVRKEKRHG